MLTKVQLQIRLPGAPGPKAPGVAIRGDGGGRAASGVRDAGMNWHVAKPVDPRRLAVMPAKCLKDAGSA